MSVKHSLRHRIIVAFALFSLLSSLLFGLVMSLATVRVEDFLFNRRLAEELKYCQESLDQTGNLPEPTIPLITFITEPMSIPGHIREKILNLKPGIHELTEFDLHVAVAPRADSGKPLYVIYDVESLEIKLKNDLVHISIIIMISVLFAIIGLGIALAISRRIIKPVTDLSNLVQATTPDAFPENFSQSFPDDEVGALARKCEDFIQRIQAHVIREQQFTRFASHELRSPVTVIKGAVELLEMNATEATATPLNRIKRAVMEMEDTINVFLLLSREDLGSLESEEVNLKVLINELIEQQQAVINTRRITVYNHVDSTLTVTTHRKVLRLVLSNLFRNACHFTADGSITFEGSDAVLTISDTGTGMDPTTLNSAMQPFVKSKASAGHGLGLAIVDMICQRYGWSFELSSKAEEGTRATIRY